MHLVKDTTVGAYAVQVCCVGASHMVYDALRRFPRRSRMFTLAEGYADIDGEAFVSYYCDGCVFHDKLLHSEVSRA